MFINIDLIQYCITGISNYERTFVSDSRYKSKSDRKIPLGKCINLDLNILSKLKTINNGILQKNNFTIGADGYLYACIEVVGTEKYRQCHVNLYNTIYYQFQQAKFSELNNVSIACRQCKFLPV